MAKREMKNSAPCKFMPKYHASTSANGIVCNIKDFNTHCGKCGFNPEVAKKRLLNGIVKLKEVSCSYTEEEVNEMQECSWNASFYNYSNPKRADIDDDQRHFYK